MAERRTPNPKVGGSSPPGPASSIRGVVKLKWLDSIVSFLRNVRAEIKKVSWPSQSEVITMTILILGMVILLSAYIGGVDLVYKNIIQQILNL